MTMRRIRGSSMRAALRAVERELGPGALIVETRAVGGGYEIAAIPGPARRPATAGGSGGTPAFAPLARRAREFGLPESLVRRVDAAVRAAGLAQAEPGARAVERTAVDALSRLLPTRQVGPGPRATAFVGPTGVGKTTTIAKLAARAAHNRRRIALASFDAARPGASAPLEHLARAIDVPFTRVGDGAGLSALLDAPGSDAHLLVDTAGSGPRDHENLRGLATALADPRARTILCIPAATRRVDADAIVDGWSAVTPEAAVVTKWDETLAAGETLGVLADREVPVAWVAIGQRVPDDLVDADAAALAACALGVDEELARELLV